MQQLSDSFESKQSKLMAVEMPDLDSRILSALHGGSIWPLDDLCKRVKSPAAAVRSSLTRLVSADVIEWSADDTVRAASGRNSAAVDRVPEQTAPAEQSAPEDSPKAFAPIGTITLRQVWADYQKSRDLKPITVRNYGQRLNQHMGDWLDLPITAITKDMCEDRHRSIPGKAIANSSFRTLRALLHYASFKYEDESGAPVIKRNPVHRLSEVRAWHRDNIRKTVIRPQQLNAWFRAVFGLQNSTIRDLLVFTLLTGLRKMEVLNLRWCDVDLQIGTIQLHNTKNGDDVTLPLSNYALNIIASRKFGAISEYVFPGHKIGAPLRGIDKSIATVCELSGVQFCMHDLRRGYVTMGDELDLKTEVIRALVNHRAEGVTEGYIVRSMERLRRATQQITDRILAHAGLKKAQSDAQSGLPACLPR